MSTDAWVRIPHYNFVGYNDQGIIWSEPLGSIWVQVTSDGDEVLGVVRQAMLEAYNSTYASFMTPEGFTGVLVRWMNSSGWDSVLLCLQEPQEGKDYSYTVDFKTKTIVVHGTNIDNRYSFKQLREGRLVYDT